MRFRSQPRSPCCAVVLIIGLLIGLAMHQVGDKLNQAREGRVRGDIQRIKTNLVMYQAANGFYPTTEQGLKALVQKTGNRAQAPQLASH